MKRVVCFLSALALAVGAIAPAAFASDAGYGQTDLIPLEDLDQETFDTYLAKFYSQDYPTYGVLDLIRDTFEGGLANASGLNDSPWSWALNLVDNASDLGTEVGLWMTGIKIDPNTGKAIYPDDYLTDYAKQQLDTQLKTTPSVGGQFQINGHVWTTVPYTSSTNSSIVRIGNSWDSPLDVYATSSGGYTVLAGYYSSSDVAGYTLFVNSNTSDGRSTGTYTYGGVTYRAGRISSQRYPLVCGTSQYGNMYDALADFYGNFSTDLLPSGQPEWNNTGYYSENQTGFSINLPSLPSTNWGNLSKYYYTTYGDEIVEGDVDRYYYNIANNYVPYEISYELPYWLINGSSNVLDFNYDLELPDADLYSVPSDFEGGSGFWDKAFSSLGGFGSFIMLGLSFGLVALFFKD